MQKCIDGYRDNREEEQKAGEDASSSDSILERILGQLGCVSQECREISWQEARESYAKTLTTLENQHASYSAEILGYIYEQDLKGFIGGDEHILFMQKDRSATNVETPFTSRIYKITHSECFGCGVIFDPYDIELTGKHFHARGNADPWLYMKRWQLLNSISSYTTKFEAIIVPEKPG